MQNQTHNDLMARLEKMLQQNLDMIEQNKITLRCAEQRERFTDKKL